MEFFGGSVVFNLFISASQVLKVEECPGLRLLSLRTMKCRCPSGPEQPICCFCSDCLFSVLVFHITEANTEMFLFKFGKRGHVSGTL